MTITLSLDLLENEFYYVTPTKPVSTVPLVYVTFSTQKNQIAYSVDKNEPKLIRSIERQIKAALKSVVQENDTYRMQLDQDKVLSVSEQRSSQEAYIDSVIRAFQEIPELPMIRVEFAGSWPVFQTEAGRLTLE